jgi:hypothetical protein
MIISLHQNMAFMIPHTTTFVSIYAICDYKWLHDYVVYKTMSLMPLVVNMAIVLKAIW